MLECTASASGKVPLHLSPLSRQNRLPYCVYVGIFTTHEAPFVPEEHRPIWEHHVRLCVLNPIPPQCLIDSLVRCAQIAVRLTSLRIQRLKANSLELFLKDSHRILIQNSSSINQSLNRLSLESTNFRRPFYHLVKSTRAVAPGSS